MIDLSRKKPKEALNFAAGILFVYLLWTIETLFPVWFPEFSLIFIILSSLSFSEVFATLLGFFLGFLSDHLAPIFFGRFTLFFTFLAFLLSHYKNYIIFSYPYLFILVLISLFLKGLIGGFNWTQLILTLLFAIPAIKVLRKFGEKIWATGAKSYWR
uniref:Rod shape-determining protein MreD n=1 Tax=candidate division WOR-3 bacterium TaxID=2052148 RepID=A0A7C3YUR2_UNCW3